MSTGKEVDMVRLSLHRKRYIFLQFDLDPVRCDQIGIVKTFSASEFRLNLQARRAPCCEYLGYIAYLEAEVVHHSAFRGTCWGAFRKHYQHSRYLHCSKWPLLYHNAIEVINPKFLVYFDVSDVQVHMSKGHASLIG